MKMWTPAICVLVALLWGVPTAGWAQETPTETTAAAAAGLYEPKIVSSDFEKIVIELTVPPIRVLASEVREARGQMIALSGYSQTATPGAPQVPLRGFSIGIPEDAEPTLHILDQQVETRQLRDIPPAPGIRYERPQGDIEQPADIRSRYVWDRDESIYSRNEFYPSETVNLGNDGIMRDQRLMTFQVHPVQYNPVQQRIRYTSKITFAIYYNGGRRSTWNAANASEAFESVFRSTLLNYEIAKNWRIQRSGLQKAAADDYFLNQGDEWYKILLETPGIYVLDKTDLESAGLNTVGIDPRNIKLFNKGVEIAIRITGEDDGSFDEGDTIEFYGTAFKNYYTTTNVYWLTVSDSPGKRMQARDVSHNAENTLVERTQFNFRKEIDFLRRADYPGHTDNERWFMESVYPSKSTTHIINLRDISNNMATDCGFTLQCLGVNADEDIDPDHHITVTLNGIEILNEYWDGQTFLLKSVNFPQENLVEGENVIELIAPGDTGISFDYIFHDFFELSYWRENIAVDDSITLSTNLQGEFTFVVNGFSNDQIHVYDISETSNVVNLVNFELAEENNEFSIKFNETLDRDRTYYILSNKKTRKPIDVYKDRVSNLRSSKDTDYLMISPSDFISGIELLSDYYKKHDLSVTIIDIQDIYDEFNHGFYEEKSIKEFFQYITTNWTNLPSYALMVGDASFNPRIINPDYWGDEKSDFVPTRLFESIEDNFEAASDNWFVALDGESDVLPDILIGRLPVRSESALKVAVEKITNYKTDFQSGVWNNTATFVADNGEGGVLAFEDSSDAFIRDLIPTYFTKKRAYLSQLGSAAATRDEIKKAINSGTLITNYYGHGSVRTWANENLFSADDVPSLRNDNKGTFLLTLSCINGYFVDPRDDFSGLAEVMFRERQRGAIAVFSGSGEAYPSPVLALGRGTYSSLFLDHNTTLGTFANAGLVKMYASYPDLWDHVLFYLVFGDPATQLHYQPSLNVVSAGFEGSLSVNNAAPPVGTTLVASMESTVYTSTSTQADGAFGPIYIRADDPDTPHKEGGVPGDSVTFHAVLDSDTLQLLPRAAWNAGEVQTLNLRPLTTGIAAAIDITWFADTRQFGKDIFDGDYISNTTQLVGVIHSPDATVTANAVQLLLNEQPMEVNQMAILPDEQNPQHKLRVQIPVHTLRDGEYTLTARVLPEQSLASVAQAEVSFALQSTLSLSNVVNFPNPMTQDTQFTYVLSNDRPAQIKIGIYTVAGRLIRSLDTAAGQVGYNETYWDGRDAEGDALANGVYFYKIQADDGKETTEVIERLVVMQ